MHIGERHDRENLFCVVYKEFFKLACYRASETEKKNMVRVEKPRQQVAVNISRLNTLVDQC